MKKIKDLKILSNRYIKGLALVVAGILIGSLFFHHKEDKTNVKSQSVEESRRSVWTCAMHPQIRKDKPGKCPICGMDLVPLSHNKVAPGDSDAVSISSVDMRLAGIQTSKVTKQLPGKEIRLYGRVEADERNLRSLVAQVQGRIENLNINFTGETVNKGQKLAEIYSSDLITAQQELLETATSKNKQPELYEAAKEKLRQMKLSDTQIALMESSGIAISTFEVLAGSTGTVTSRKVNNGDYVSKGTPLFEVVDLSKVWIIFDAYESDLPFIKKEEKIAFNIQALPENHFSGKIDFIDPVIDPVTRVAEVRIEADNGSGELKPGMFATGIVTSPAPKNGDLLAIPRSAVLWTGKRSVVYVKQTGTAEALFKMHEITLGPAFGESYSVSAGLSEGEEVVTYGTFSVDAAAQLDGKPSMMNTPAEPGIKMEHADFHVSGDCELCKARIEKAALSVKGVSHAEWDIKTRMLDLLYDVNKVDVLDVHKSVAAAGHDTQFLKAADEIYNALPECCRYRK